MLFLSERLLMMRNRVLMARFDRKMMLTSDKPSCGCGQPFDEGETILLYPIPESDDIRIRDMVCMTCHFWFVHEVMESM